MVATTETASLPRRVSQTASPASTGITTTGGANQKLSGSNDHSLSTPAILGIALAVVLSIVGSVIFTIVMHRRRRRATSQARRRTIMDAEFAVSMPHLQNVSMEKSSNIGYFDIAKPLPVVTMKEVPQQYHSSIEEDRLSRSSTIVAAAEIAQINRKASIHQKNHKESREQQRERNHALQILITNEDNRTSVLNDMPRSPLASNPTTPVRSEPIAHFKECSDGNGDAFAKRPSKI